MSQLKQNYNEHVKQVMPKSRHLRNAVCAFCVGGLICVLGEAINKFGAGYFQLGKQDAAAFQAIILVFLGATLTGLDIYQRLGKFAGAGSIVPITGFANSIVAPAMEFKREGLVMGTGAKMFTIAGPVLVNGYSVSVIIGLIYCMIGR